MQASVRRIGNFKICTFSAYMQICKYAGNAGRCKQ